MQMLVQATQRLMTKIGGRRPLENICGKSGGKRGTEEIGGKSRKRGMTIVSMASEIGTNVVSLHFEFCHWNKL